ncbi:MAG TPA: FAD:protein FMN transferase [Rhodothermales bacterium]
MGLQVRVLLYAPSENRAFQAASAAFHEIARLDSILSDYRVDSELMRLVGRAGTGPVAVSDDLFRVLAHAQRLAHESGGAFDVTVSPLVRLWRRARASGSLPDSAAIDSARAFVGYRYLHLDSAASSVTLEMKGMQIDLGGIAKGYAADRALAALRSNGIDRVLIEFGGDVRVGDAPPGEEGWRIEVANADEEHRVLVVVNAAVATSGDTEQFVEIDGTRYSHVVDPETGMGLTSRAVATVVASEGIVADPLATALTILPPEEGKRLLADHYPDVQAFVRRMGPDGPSVYSVSRTR